MAPLLFQATLYLLAMVVAVPVASRLGLGSVLGYLAAGILIGPVFGLVGSESDDLQHVAEFGVVLMLFLIGLELDPRALWNMRKKLLGLGGLQIVLTTAVIFSIGLALHLSWQVALTSGLVLSLSSTAIVLQTLTEKQLMQTSGGRGAFAVLLMQDIAVIPILALLPLLALPAARAIAEAMQGDHSAMSFLQDLPGWGVTLVTLAAVAIVVLAGHFLVRPAYRFVHSARLREIQTAFALLIVVAIAALMTLVGLSPALGTFLAGVILANSEFRHELESDIAPFKGLLLGLFFVTVGSGMDLDLLLDKPLKVLLLTLALMFFKGAILYALGWLFSIKGRNRWLFTLSIAQAGEFGFVLTSFAVAQRILPVPTAQTLVLVITLSMLLTPLFFLAYDRFTRRLEDHAATEADEIDDQQPIIIAGVGRFGQVVNRMVTQSGFRTTVLDPDLKTIEVMRTFGFKGFVGDPTRPDLLKAAGFDTAKVLVICFDDPKKALQLTKYARRLRPDIHIIARAHDREHVFQLYQAGANDIVREYFDSSLRVARYVLENMGLSEYEANEVQKLFFDLDRASVRELASVWRPGVPMDKNPDYIARVKELNRDLESALLNHMSRDGSQEK
ncbi:monovalent cation:proton antiporter-2 (CPA2) family protein [Frigidibacter sp. SD6-1]|uniref:monovalent cation:proton antiporter-2 (CPA2) family protein n=1 Tax=Frigidibacter sp. SD6-1 TaxID=3032581 RepID=UPI0024DFF774|nr:monovalent cation:proton antiporter-2 (CPA2) family protein [Frigidibacter sp. SD6-1]